MVLRHVDWNLSCFVKIYVRLYLRDKLVHNQIKDNDFYSWNMLIFMQETYWFISKKYNNLCLINRHKNSCRYVKVYGWKIWYLYKREIIIQIEKTL